MSEETPEPLDLLDLLIVGAGPTGIAVGAEAKRRGLSTLLVDQGPLCASLQAYPADLEFFTTRERLEIAGVPFTVPEVKPNRRQALVYYREVVKRHDVPLALYETVESVERVAMAEEGGGGDAVRSGGGDRVDFMVRSLKDGRVIERRARAVALATGYFWNPVRLGVPGEELPWVLFRYVEPYPYFGRRVAVIGGGNSAAKTALDLWRNDAVVTLVHRRPAVKDGVKYWIKPDLENRIAEGSIAVRFESRVTAFRDAAGGDPTRRMVLETPEGVEELPVDAVFVQVGYAPDVSLQRRAGVEVDPESLIPAFDPETCESNVPGLYVAGTLQAGRFTDRIFIENSRDHGDRIVAHLKATL
jgi:thioredoxin reductase (NADPH)